MPDDAKRLLYLCADRGIPIGGTKGASIHVREFVEALPQIGYDPIIAASRFESNGDSSSNRMIHQLPSSSEPTFLEEVDEADLDKQTLREAKDYYRNQEVERSLEVLYQTTPFDIIYERYSLFNTAGRAFAARENIPFVLEVNAPLVLEADKYRQLSQVALAQSVERYLFTQADHVVAVSENLKQYILGVAPETKVTVVPNGVSVERFQTDINEHKSSKLGALPLSAFRVGFVGSIKPWHGVDLLIQAFAALAVIEPDCHLCVVGNGDADYENSLRQRCAENGLSDQVTFLGAVPFEEIPVILKSMDVLVAPYPDLKNFYFSPLKVYEYMASGRPIVASAIGQISDVLVPDRTALLVPPGNAPALTAGLMRLLRQPALRSQLAEAALANVAQNHTWRQRMITIEQILKTSQGHPTSTGKV